MQRFWKNNTTLYFKLREGVKFHNGDEMKASDVVFSLKRCIEMGSTGGANIKMAKEFRAISDYEVEIELNEVNVDYLSFLALPYSSVVSEKAVKADEANGMKIGTGSWVYVDMVESDYLKLKRNDNTWREEKPKTETLTIRNIPEASTRLIALQNGEIDVCDGINTTELDIVKQDANLVLNAIDATTCRYFAFNTVEGPGSDVNFRLAMAYALDKEELLIVGNGGYGKVADVYWGWSTFGYDNTIPGIKRDLDKAKEYLAKTNYREITITCTGSYKTVVETIQAQMKDIGITVHVNEVQSAAQTAMTKFAVHEHEAMVYGLSWNEHGEDCRRPYYKDSNTNKAVVTDQEIYDWVDAAKKEFDEAKRKELYSNIQKKNVEQSYYMPIYYSVNFVATDANAGGIQYAPNAVHDYSYLCVAAK
jgi:peptide/nickel transport system substrate-binding protein